MPIDWTDETCQITPHFTVKDALWLPTWNRLANEADGLNDGIKNNLIDLYTNCMEPLRDLLGPIIVHVTYRPEAYNKLIGGAPASAHMLGKACDWHASVHSINEAKDLILLHDMLNKLNVRMESGTMSWIHIGNDYTPGHNRVFLP
jgi:hypothetical protein